MALSLPQVDSTHLENSPLEVVVAQIRYDHAPQAVAGHIALAVHETLGGASGPYPNVDQIASQMINVALGPEAPQAEQTSGPPTMWRFASKDGWWIVSLTPDFVALETTRYRTWTDDFRVRLGQIVDAVAEHLRPALNPRIGVRYIDRIVELGLRSPAEWTPYLSGHLLGLVCDPALGPGIRQAQQQVLIEVDEDTSCTLRHGFIAEGDRLDYLMDFDVFRQAGRAFDAAEIMQASDSLNDYALRLFHSCVTPKLLDALR